MVENLIKIVYQFSAVFVMQCSVKFVIETLVLKEAKRTNLHGTLQQSSYLLS